MRCAKTATHVFGSFLARYGGLDTPEKRAAVGKWVMWANATLDPILFKETPQGKVIGTSAGACGNNVLFQDSASVPSATDCGQAEKAVRTPPNQGAELSVLSCGVVGTREPLA